MNNFRFYFDRSLVGFVARRAKEKWFTPPSPPPPKQVNHHGVLLALEGLPESMQQVLRVGHYEYNEMKILPGFICSEDRVLEIGGAIGFIGLYCRKIAGVKQLVSVEPNPKTISYLRRNYELNGFTPSIIAAALASADGPVQLTTSDMFWVDSLVTKKSESTNSCITVEGLSFASLLKRVGFTCNTLIIDIEGGEEHLPLDLIPDYVNKILIELHPDITGKRQAYNILESFLRLRFVIENHYSNAWALKRSS